MINPEDLWHSNLFGMCFRIWCLHSESICSACLPALLPDIPIIFAVSREQYYQVAKTLGIHNFTRLSMHPLILDLTTLHSINVCSICRQAAVHFLRMCKNTLGSLKCELVNKFISARFIFRLENEAQLAYMQRGFACLTSSQPLCWK